MLVIVSYVNKSRWTKHVLKQTLSDMRSNYAQYNFAQVTTEQLYGQLGSPVEIQDQTHLKAIGRSMTSKTSVLVPSSILPPHLTLKILN